MNTSYFAQAGFLHKDRELVSISRVTPDWFTASFPTSIIALELAPSMELLLAYKNDEISEKDYEIRYRDETLSLLDPKEIAEKYKNSVFLCYEKTGDFCHRRILASWLEESGYTCLEIDTTVKNICVIGSRGYSDFDEFEKVLKSFLLNYGHVDLISGGAESGADRMVKRFCIKYGYSLLEHLPDWSKYGKNRAGFIRNEKIWTDSAIGIAFWDGKSPGTAHSFKISKKQGKPFTVFNTVSKQVSFFENKILKQASLF